MIKKNTYIQYFAKFLLVFIYIATCNAIALFIAMTVKWSMTVTFGNKTVSVGHSDHSTKCDYRKMIWGTETAFSNTPRYYKGTISFIA